MDKEEIYGGMQMIFTVTHRTSQGSLKLDNFKAASRSELMSELKSKGIAPVSIRVCEDKHDRSGKFGSEREEKRNILPLIIVLGITIICLATGLVMMLGKKDVSQKPPAPAIAPKPLQKPLAKPQAAVTNVVAAKTLTLEELHFAETNGMSKGRLKLWLRKHDKGPVYTNGANRVKTLEERTFRHGAEVHIAGLLRLEPGSSLLGDSSLMYGKAFMKSFKKSLEEPIIISEEDSDEVKELKKAVIQTKEELKHRMNAGEDICKIMRDTRDDLKKIGLYRDELNRQLIDLGKDGQYSEQDMQDFVSAANQMLSERGAKPLTMPRVLMYKFEKMKKQKGEQK